MATIRNARDLLLQAAPSRYSNPPNAAIILAASSPVFHIAVGGAHDPDSITFTASLIGLTGPISFVATGGTLTVVGNVATLTYANIPGATATVKAVLTENGQSYESNVANVTKISDGTSGTTSYTWIKYGTSAAGAGLSDSPDGMTYIGLAHNKPTAIESTVAADYTWSLIKGTDGVAGATGADGQTTYTWLKYSDNPDGTGLYDIPTSTTLYIGLAVNKTTATESTVKTDYVWSKFKGDQGVPGPSVTGPAGARGAGHFYAIGNPFTDALANAATPGENVVDDVVTVSAADGTYALTKKWNGSAWLALGQVIDGSLAVTGSFTAAAIDTRGLVSRAPDGTVILDVGGLRTGFEAPGTKNADVIPLIDAAAINGSNLVKPLTDSSWSAGAAIVTVTDGAIGPTVRRSIVGGNVVFDQSTLFPIDRSRTYRTRFWARASATANGSLYHTLRQYLASGATGLGNGGRDPYKPVNVAPHTNWVEYSQAWANADWQANVTHVRPDFLLNYRPDAVAITGYWEIQGFEMLDVTEVVAAQAQATTAFNKADAANAVLAIISDDNKLSKGEKPAVILEWQTIQAEATPLYSQAGALGNLAERDAFNNAYTALLNYMNTLDWATLTTDTTIDGPTFRLKFKDYYAAKIALQNANDAKAATTASALTLGATGILSGPGGAQGRMTALPVIDLGDGTHFGARNRVDAPSEYNVGTSSQFKQSTTYGLSSADGFYFTLDTIKQYTDGTGGGVYQYAYQGIKTWRRQAPNAIGGVTTWQAWYQDLDRNAYTGDLDASKDITLVARNGVTIQGNKVLKSGGNNATWDADARSLNGFIGGAYCSAVVNNFTTQYMFGLNTDPETDGGFRAGAYESLDFAFYIAASTQLYIYESNVGLGIFGTAVAGDVLSVVYNGVNVVYMRNQTVLRTVAATITLPLFFDSSLHTIGASFDAVRFGPLSSNNWSAVGGAGRPANDATVGAPNGTLVGGSLAQTVEANAANALANAAAANNALTGKLNKNADEVLGAVLIANTVGVPVGLRVGSVTWNTAGDWTGGTGVAITPKGIAAYAAGGTVQFVLNATTGAATFAGALSAATGSFAGSLSAVTGSFGAVTIAAGGSIASGQTDFAVGSGWYLGFSAGLHRFSIGDANQYLRWNGSTLDIKQDTFSAALFGSLLTQVAPGLQAYGQLSASIVGGTAPFTYVWSANGYADNGSGGSYGISGGQGGVTCGFAGSASNCTIIGTITLTVTDSKNRTASASYDHNSQHGTPQ